jgi:hypothetical protein
MKIRVEEFQAAKAALQIRRSFNTVVEARRAGAYECDLLFSGNPSARLLDIVLGNIDYTVINGDLEEAQQQAELGLLATGVLGLE